MERPDREWSRTAFQLSCNPNNASAMPSVRRNVSTYGKHRCAEKRTEECAQCAARNNGDSQIEVPLAAAPKPEQRANRADERQHQHGGADVRIAELKDRSAVR